MLVVSVSQRRFQQANEQKFSRMDKRTRVISILKYTSLRVLCRNERTIFKLNLRNNLSLLETVFSTFYGNNLIWRAAIALNRFHDRLFSNRSEVIMWISSCMKPPLRFLHCALLHYVRLVSCTVE